MSFMRHRYVVRFRSITGHSISQRVVALGLPRRGWQRHEIDSVEVGVAEYTSDGSTVYDYYVKVSPVPLKEQHWFSHLTKMEIQWIVDSLQIALEMDRENDGREV